MRGICPSDNGKNIVLAMMMVYTNLISHFVLVMTLWVRSTSALLDLLTSSSSFSGRESIASAARLACFAASSLARCIPRLFPRYSIAWIFNTCRSTSNSYAWQSILVNEVGKQTAKTISLTICRLLKNYALEQMAMNDNLWLPFILETIFSFHCHTG